MDGIDNYSSAEEFSGWSDESGTVLILNFPSEFTGTGELALYSAEGVLVLKKNIPVTNKIGRTDLPRLSSGLYILVFEADGKIYKNKFLKK